MFTIQYAIFPRNPLNFGRLRLKILALGSNIKTEVEPIAGRCTYRIPLPGVFFQKSVRLVVNYLRTQKAVVRVSPEVPLRNILPVICAKCEVSPEHVVLLRDSAAGEELELSKSLNELGIKELYAWDNKRGEATLGLSLAAM